MTTIPPKPSRTGSERDLRAVPQPQRDHDETHVADVEPPFIAHHPGSVDDLALLPRLLRIVSLEVNDVVARVSGVIVPAIRRIEERQYETDRYLVQEFRAVHARLDELLAKIESR